MPTTVGVNKLSIVHKQSGGTVAFMPDLCKTPQPSGPPVPIPYPNTYLSLAVTDGAGKALADVLYVLQTPDGKRVEGRTDGSGKISVEETIHGIGRVTFPDLADATGGALRVTARRTATPRGRAARAAPRRGGRIACGLLLAIAACTPASSTKAKDTGAVMTSEGVTLRRLGDVSPHVSYVGTEGRDFVDPSPVVLWGGGRPAAVLYLGIESRGRKAVQRFAPVDASVRVPGFPVTVAVEAPPDATSMDGVDAIDTSSVISADVDGDGVDELVLVRKQGGVEVHSLRGPVAQLASPSAGPGGARYRRFLSYALPLGGREVVYVLSVCDAPGVDDRNLLVRVDGRSVTRVRLEGLERAPILALGAIQRSGSRDVDELLVLTADGDADAVLGRWRPDGKPLAPARRMYVRPSRESAFRFVPGSSHAVLEVEGGVLVLSPEKPANWIRELKPWGRRAPRDATVLSVADLDGDPKLQYAVGDALWAVNHDGAAFAPAGAGRWTPLAKPGPYLRVPVPAGEKLWLVWRSEAGPLLAVSSRARGMRPMTHEELAKAADRYLSRDEAESYRKLRAPSLEGRHLLRDERIAEEREKRRVTAEIHTVEEWRRLLPDSYADVAKADLKTHDDELAARFAQLRDDPEGLARTPDPSGLRAFLGALDVPARTTFMVVDGTAVSTVQIPGAPLRLLETQMGGPIEYRLAQGRIDAILALEGTDDLGRPPPAFYEVEASLAARR